MRRGRGDFTGTAEDLARLFDETYQRLQPRFYVDTRGAGIRDWESLTAPVRGLLIAVFEELLFGEAAADQPDASAAAEGAER
mgnify:CR=1 FL=1